MAREKHQRMGQYHSVADDYFVNMNLNTEMELPQTRDTVLHFFEQVRKQYPAMRNFYTRDKGEFVLEEDKDRGSYRWSTIEHRRVSSGYINPLTVDEAMEQHALVLDLVPYDLSISPLDCESLNVMYGFDFAYRGNHSELIAEALGVVPAFEKLARLNGSQLLGADPSIQMALDDDCRLQCRLGIEARTSAYHVRTREFPEEVISVYFTVRRYGALETGETFVTAMKKLANICQDLVDNYVVENVLRPLQQAIAIR